MKGKAGPGLMGEFERLSEAPGAMGEIRRLILDLAVRGKLVAQEAGDEPAGVLLKRIAAEKARYWASSEKKKQQSLPDTLKVDPIFQVPSSWHWTRLEDCFAVSGGIQKTPARTPQKNAHFYLGVGNVYRGKLDLSEVKQFELFEGELERFRLTKGDIVVVEGNGSLNEIGRCAAWSGEIDDCVHQNHIIRCRPFIIGITDYVLQYLNSPQGTEVMKTLAVTSSGLYSLSVGKIRSIYIPLPPLAEQKRIVAKVDQLMALCDRLEAAQTVREYIRDRLAKASIHQLNTESETQNAPAYKEQARFFIQQLPRISTRPEHIGGLRQAILNLAVRGKLVAQDAGDEPAGVLLKRIAAEKARLVKEGRIKSEVKSTSPKDTESPYIIPPSWMWTRFGEIMISRDNDRIPVSKEERAGRAKIYDYYGASGVIDKIDGYIFDKPLLLIGEDGANLINRSTPIAFIARGKYWVNNHAHVLDGISEDFLRYIEVYINAINLKPYVTGTAQPKMNQAMMNRIPIPLPPLAEQKRIVAKVDQLMALCDQLEQQITTTQTKNKNLLKAILQHINPPKA